MVLSSARLTRIPRRPSAYQPGGSLTERSRKNMSSPTESAVAVASSSDEAASSSVDAVADDTNALPACCRTLAASELVLVHASATPMQCSSVLERRRGTPAVDVGAATCMCAANSVSCRLVLEWCFCTRDAIRYTAPGGIRHVVLLASVTMRVRWDALLKSRASHGCPARGAGSPGSSERQAMGCSK